MRKQECCKKNYMIFTLSLSLILLFSSMSFYGKDKNNFRVVTLAKVFQINDTGKNYFLKYPDKIFADENQSIYILDNNRVLRFSKDGSFSDELVRQGQGPSEVTNVSNLDVSGDHILIHNNYRAKIIRLDKKGTFLNEFSFGGSEWMTFSHHYNGRYYVLSSQIPVIKSSQEYTDVAHIMFAVSPESKEKSQIYSFPVKQYIVRHNGASGSFSIAEFLSVPLDGRYLFVSHTPEYNIKCLDLKDNKIIADFGLKYERKEIPEKLSKKFNIGMTVLSGKMFKRPVQKYFNDIHKLLIHQKNVWAVTSDVDENKGVRIDVFNQQGLHKETFYLKLEGQYDMYSFNWTISGDFLYTLELTDDGPIVKKFKISL